MGDIDSGAGGVVDPFSEPLTSSVASDLDMTYGPISLDSLGMPCEDGRTLIISSCTSCPALWSS